MPSAAAPISPITHTMKGAVYAFTDSRNHTVIVGVARSSATAPGSVGISHADGRGWKVPLRMLRVATPEEMTAHFTALQAKVATLPTFKKGDVVEFDHKGKVIRGIVMSNKLLSGNRVSIDQSEAYASWKVPAGEVRLAKVQTGDAGLMAGYEIRGFLENKRLSEETLCFSANVFLNGKVVATLKNRGHGGSTDVDAGMVIGKMGALDVARARSARHSRMPSSPPRRPRAMSRATTPSTSSSSGTATSAPWARRTTTTSSPSACASRR